MLFGTDLRAEIRALHVAISEAILDLGRELRDDLPRQIAPEVLKRNDLILERLDKKAEGLFAVVSRRLSDLERKVEPETGEVSAVEAPASAARSGVQAGDPFTDATYREFEELFRGGESDVLEKVQGYVDLFELSPVVDLGCGRGELLGALREAGIDAYGVDSNGSMIEHCRAKGLQVFHEDLLEHLIRLQEATLGGIVATQVVEHMRPAGVQRLLAEARRVLVPGGRIVLETPNPTSVWAYTQNWVRDPTHRWAVHPDTLRFMATKAGLRVIDIRFTTPVPEGERLKASDPDTDRLNHFLYGPQDFALVAERPRREDRLG